MYSTVIYLPSTERRGGIIDATACHTLGKMDLAQSIAVAKDLLTGVAATVAAGVAVVGLETWKRQLRGNANYELSRRLLRSAYKLREAIRSARAAILTTGEMAAAIKAAGLDASSARVIDDQGEALAFQARWDKVVAAQIEFAAEVLEAEALWGPLIRERSEALGKCTEELRYALQQWVGRTKRQIDLDRQERIMATIYEGYDDSDEFSNRLKKTFESLEDIIRPHLKL